MFSVMLHIFLSLKNVNGAYIICSLNNLTIMFEFPFRLQNLYLVKSEQFVTFEITSEPFYVKFIFFKSYICESESSMFSIQSHCCIKDMKEMTFLGFFN